MADGKKADLSVKGQTGLPIWHGKVYDEVLLDLQGDRGRRIFREMAEQDPIIGGVLNGIEMLARQVTWTMKPADDTKVAEKAAEFVDECLTDMSPTFGDTLAEVLSMLTYGWSWLEIIYKRRKGLKVNDRLRSSRFDDNKIGWAGWHIRGQETLWEWLYENSDSTGELVGMKQNPPPNYHTAEVPRWKSLHFMTKSRRQNPEGVSILRSAYRSWYMKKNIEIVEGIGVERDLAGLPVLYAPSDLFSISASDEQKALFEDLKKLVVAIKRDEQEGILMPMAYDEEGKNPLYKLELLSAGGERQFDTNAIINRYDERIAMSMLADFILMGHSNTGSFALSTTKTGLFATAMSAILDVITDEINAEAITKLCVLNGIPLKKIPSLQHGKVETTDLTKVGEYLRQLNAAGMTVFPNEALEIYLLGQAGLPSDVGAGRLPFPGTADQLLLDKDGKPVLGPDGQPMLDPNAPPPLAPGQQSKTTGVDGDQPDLATPPRPQTLAQRSAKAQRQQAPKAASESKKHFISLPNRFAKIREQLTEQMTTEEYSELLFRVMEAGKFSALSDEDQELIRQAESAE